MQKSVASTEKQVRAWI